MELVGAYNEQHRWYACFERKIFLMDSTHDNILSMTNVTWCPTKYDVEQYTCDLKVLGKMAGMSGKQIFAKFQLDIAIDTTRVLKLCFK